MSEYRPPIIVKPTLSYTVDEAAASTGIGRSTLYEDQAAGRIEFRKRGRSTIILADELARYLGALPVMPAHRIAE